MKIGTISRASKFSFATATLAAFLISSSVTFAGENNPGAVSPHQSGFNILPKPNGGGNLPSAPTILDWANVGTDWSTGANWVGGVAPTSSTTANIAEFGVQGGAPVNPNVGSAQSIAGVSFLSGAFSYTIGGSALTVGSIGISNSATNTETFSNAVGPSINSTWTTASGGTTVFNGAVNINSNTAANRFLTISGAGTTTINGVVQNSFAGSTGHLTYTGTGTLNLLNTNTYNGGTIISGAGGTLFAGATGALGTGNISLTATSVTLTLQGASNNYIGDTANLSFINGDTINLNFTGTDTIGALIVDGVSLAPGLYGAAGTNPDGDFNGTGFLLVTTQIPERSTWSMLVMGAALLLGVQRWRRRRTS